MSKGHKSTEAEYIRLHYSWYGAVEIPSLRSGNYTVKERHYCSGRTQRKRTGNPPQCQAGMTWRNSTCLTARVWKPFRAFRCYLCMDIGGVIDSRVPGIHRLSYYLAKYCYYHFVASDISRTSEPNPLPLHTTSG
ncbi:hypothetical protein BDBG_16732 [Blastomyces gilchristii SLH14081]|uniref:Uncharacterized protein n=1 Tax=Blastomyces gilchristii (strain SLH14081) TaxID=559298 RepID=A0A179UI07_BLAGS|nr:uncharacterized protein BDBG_16732 [Blastomyces gilchristii SLH14081]OAT06869.1 hypothetical protein BDBG_16732 [Blastomyces gilchristii SLH14081]